MNYDTKYCNHVEDIGNSRDLADEVRRLLKDFYEAVNEYFKQGVTNYKSGFRFNFSFEIVGNNIADDDPYAEAMLQYTSRRERPRDKHIRISGGSNSKYITKELILPAYSYLTYKCDKLNFYIRESHDRHCGAPVTCEPRENSIDNSGIAEGLLVTAAESPKLYDGMFEPEQQKEQSAKTNVFGERSL